MANVNAGQLRGNPDAEATNFLKLTRCDDCDTVAAPCQDTLTATVAGTVKIVSIDVIGASEVVTTLPTPILVTDTDALRDAILGLLNMEVDPVLNVTYEGGVLTVVHIGAAQLKNMTTDAPATIDGTRICTIAEQCEFCATLVGEIGDIGYDGNTETLANNPYAWTGDAGDDADTATALHDDLETALDDLNWTYVSVTVTVDDVAEAYKVVIVSNESVAPSVGDSYFQKRNCETIFTA